MGRARRKFDRDFKVSAVKLVTEQGYALRAAGKSLGINPNLISRWRGEFRHDPDSSFPGNGQQIGPMAELKRLQAELVKVKRERDILKKAAIFFAEGST